MRKAFAVVAMVGVVFALALPAGAKTNRSHTTFAVTGEARALELALGQQGATLGLAMARADSTPRALGVGAGQCTLLGDTPNPDDLPCTDETTVKTTYPGTPGTGKPSCAASLPEPLNAVADLKLACGSSRSGLTRGLPTTRNSGKISHLGVTLPVGTILSAAPTDELVKDITKTLAPVLDLAPQEVKDAVQNVVDLVSDVAETEALAVQLGPSSSNVTPKGKILRVDSSSAGALIGVLGIPEARVDGTAISASSDPLKNGLIIIEVGTARASASLNTTSAVAAAAASPALVTVKVRDITKDEPTYVEVSVAPGETVTVLQGTPAESTITAADSTVEENGTSAAAGADAVRLHLLKGVQGGVSLAVARATAAVTGDVVKPAPPVKKAPPEVLPVTGGTDMTVPALGLMLIAGVAFLVRRRIQA